MAKQTYFVVQPYEIGKRGKLGAGQPIMAASGPNAIKMAQKMKGRVAGVVAFSKTGDPETGDYDDAMILTILGSVPPEVRELSGQGPANDEEAA